jgi:tRNA U55 pseudouridine synthase TruB
MDLPRYVMLEKAVGQTPLACMEAWRIESDTAANVPLTYAGRLDPMASGKLLVLIGEECKKKDQYLALDKTYEFSVLLGVGSDTHDVLGRLTTTLGEGADALHEGVNHGLAASSAPEGRVSAPELTTQLEQICRNLTGDIELPYPHFSSKTVQGKPLHMWTLEGRLDEISIPTKTSTIYSLELNGIEPLSRTKVCDQARAKIDTIPEVTEQTKSLGNDFRRADIRKDWNDIKHDDSLPTEYSIAHFTCSASSGTYMRTLSKLIGEQLIPMVPSLAWSIHRTRIENLFK